MPGHRVIWEWKGWEVGSVGEKKKRIAQPSTNKTIMETSWIWLMGNSSHLKKEVGLSW